MLSSLEMKQKKKKVGSGGETVQIGWASEINQPRVRGGTGTFTTCVFRLHHTGVRPHRQSCRRCSGTSSQMTRPWLRVLNSCKQITLSSLHPLLLCFPSALSACKGQQRRSLKTRHMSSICCQFASPAPSALTSLTSSSQQFCSI